MNIRESLQRLTPKQEIEPPAGASYHMRELIGALNTQRPSYKERQAFKIIQEPWERLKSAPAEGGSPSRGRGVLSAGLEIRS